jgi:hypothetical protein
VIYFEEWSSKHVDKWCLYDLWVRVSGCPDTLCRDYLALFALGSLVGKATEIDMKFTRENGIVRARIDCANPKSIPRRLDYFYDGDGFAVYFDVEALDGSIVPAGEFDIGDGEDDAKDNSNDDNASKPEADPSIPPSDRETSNDPKDDVMHQDTNAKQTESVETMQVGKISIHYPSPLKTIQKKCDDQGCLSPPSKSWFSMVEEDDLVGISLTPSQAQKEPIQQVVSPSDQKMLSSESSGDYPVSYMLQAAATENSPKTLPRQVSGVFSPGSPCLSAEPAATKISPISLPWQVSGGSPPGSLSQAATTGISPKRLPR